MRNLITGRSLPLCECRDMFSVIHHAERKSEEGRKGKEREEGEGGERRRGRRETPTSCPRCPSDHEKFLVITYFETTILCLTLFLSDASRLALSAWSLAFRS